MKAEKKEEELDKELKGNIKNLNDRQMILLKELLVFDLKFLNVFITNSSKENSPSNNDVRKSNKPFNMA